MILSLAKNFLGRQVDLIARPFTTWDIVLNHYTIADYVSEMGIMYYNVPGRWAEFVRTARAHVSLCYDTRSLAERIIWNCFLLCLI